MLTATLHGENLAALSPQILLLDVTETRTEDALTVTLTLEIHEPDYTLRKQICSRIAGWAAPGGALELSDRPGQTLAVTCEVPPSLGSALHWTRAVTVTFKSADMPYWQASQETKFTKNAAAEHSQNIHPDGDGVPVPLTLRFKNSSNTTIGYIYIETPLGWWVMENLGLERNKYLEIGEENGLPYARVDGYPALVCRTPESTDRLRITSGMDNLVSVDAGASVTMEASARGAFY